MTRTSKQVLVYLAACAVLVVAVVVLGDLMRSTPKPTEAPDPAPTSTPEAMDRREKAPPTEEELMDVKSALDNRFRNEPVDVRTVATYLDANREPPQ
jgi:hypothetical protein